MSGRGRAPAVRVIGAWRSVRQCWRSSNNVVCCTESEVACVLKQDDTGAWRVSMRSKGRIDVSQVAMDLGGGGHRYAAGFTGHGEPGEVLRSVRAALDSAPHLPE